MLKVLLRTTLLEQFRQTSNSSTPKFHTPVRASGFCLASVRLKMWHQSLYTQFSWLACFEPTRVSLNYLQWPSRLRLAARTFRLSPITPPPTPPVIDKDHNKSKKVKKKKTMGELCSDRTVRPLKRGQRARLLLREQNSGLFMAHVAP